MTVDVLRRMLHLKNCNSGIRHLSPHRYYFSRHLITFKIKTVFAFLRLILVIYKFSSCESVMVVSIGRDKQIYNRSKDIFDVWLLIIKWSTLQVSFCFKFIKNVAINLCQVLSP